MRKSDDPGPLDEFFFQARSTGRVMARLRLNKGQTDPRDILAAIESICREISIDWGLSPTATAAGIRTYLDGAREVLERFEARRRNEYVSPPPYEAVHPAREDPPIDATSDSLPELRQLCADVSAVASEARRLIAEVRETSARTRALIERTQRNLVTFRHGDPE